ncbi:MAG: tRNA pseudouridine(55) synthase TruB [Solirubrobacteraceae bacterium]
MIAEASVPSDKAVGVVVYDKPAGVTSHDVVARVRRGQARGVKVGHAGTLDPFASGLLLVLLGRATRVQRFLMALGKTYEVTARFGAVSSTGDPEGEIVPTGVVPDGELRLPTGRLRQRPPAFSAVKIDGRRAYALARAGVDVQVPEREVDVYRFEEIWRADDRRGFVIECGSGTYVRSLIADLGDAYCETLRRTRIGQFDVIDADPERVITLNDALAFLPELRLDPEQARRAGHGAAVPGDVGRTIPRHAAAAVPGDAAAAVPGDAEGAVPGRPSSGDGSGAVRLSDEHGLIAIGEPVKGELRPTVGLR